MYKIEKKTNDLHLGTHWRVTRNGHWDGAIWYTRARAAASLKTYLGLEWSTGEIRIYTGQWWPGHVRGERAQSAMSKGMTFQQFKQTMIAR